METLLGVAIVGAYTAINSCLQAGENPIEMAQDLVPDRPHNVPVQATEPKYKWRVINGVRTKVLDFT